jgi:hypothetical protein
MTRGEQIVWGTHATRVLVAATHRDELATDFDSHDVPGRSSEEKFARARRPSRHAGRVRSPIV